MKLHRKSLTSSSNSLPRLTVLLGVPVTRTNKNIRVAHILGALDRGGVEMRTLDLIRNTGDAVSTYMVTLSGREGTLAGRYKTEGARVVPMGIYSWTFFFRFISFLRRHNIDVVHSHVHHTSGFITFLAMLAGVKTRIIHYRSDGQADASLSFFARAKVRILRLMISASATKIVAVSPTTMSIAWSEKWSADPRCCVLVNGFDLSLFERSGDTPIPAYLEGIPRPLILHLGRADSPTKNRDGAIKIFNRYCERDNPGTLIFVGRDGKDDDQALANRKVWKTLTDRAGTTDRILFLGERNDVVDILHSVDLLLFTSLLEGLPGVLVESRCAGVPVIATDLPGCQFLAQHLTRVTLLAATDPDDLWVDLMEEALRNPLSFSERVEALDSLRGSEFDMNVVVRRYMELWSA